MTYSATSVTHTTVTDTATVETDPSKPSIRQICLRGIARGDSTADIAAMIQVWHPHSAGAAKSGQHISWYRSRVRRGIIKLEAE